MTMKADPRTTKQLVADDGIRSAFDPVIEGSTFQILEEGLDPKVFNREAAEDELEALEVLTTFDLADTLARVPNKLFFRIGEVAELLEVKTYVLRFWETEFPMVSPSKSRSGQRVYRKKDVEMLLLIKHLLYVERFSIEGARKRLRELKGKPAAATAQKTSVSKAEILNSGTRESLRTALSELEKLAQPELSKFFRF